MDGNKLSTHPYVSALVLLSIGTFGQRPSTHTHSGNGSPAKELRQCQSIAQSNVDRVPGVLIHADVPSNATPGEVYFLVRREGYSDPWVKCAAPSGDCNHVILPIMQPVEDTDGSLEYGAVVKPLGQHPDIQDPSDIYNSTVRLVLSYSDDRSTCVSQASFVAPGGGLNVASLYVPVGDCGREDVYATRKWGSGNLATHGLGILPESM